MDLTIPLIVAGHAVVMVCLGWLYFSRYQIVRPPVGVISLADFLVTLGGVVLIPLLYLAVPTWTLIGVLALGALSAVYVAVEPVVSSHPNRWLIILVAVVGEVVAVIGSGPGGVVACGVVGVSNLWAQSGLKARDATILAGALMVSDLIATTCLPLMRGLFERLAHLPFSPIVGWPGADGGWVGLGLGDLVVATVFPLVMRKAYGRSAGILALIVGSTLIAALLALGAVREIDIFPVMTVLGPAMMIQYAWWAVRRGRERTTYQYLRDDTSHRAAAQTSGRVSAPVTLAPDGT
jgi:hypothetical protein